MIEKIGFRDKQIIENDNAKAHLMNEIALPINTDGICTEGIIIENSF